MVSPAISFLIHALSVVISKRATKLKNKALLKEQSFETFSKSVGGKSQEL